MMEEAIVVNQLQEELIELPPGFRFHPTDEEIISCYLTEKVKNSNFVASAIGEADLNKCEPWDLPQKAKMGEKEWYLFCKRDRKYPTGMRTNRATESGYWKATGKDKDIYDKKQHKNNKCLIGMKKTLVFYRGRAPKGEKTNWVMHEYRLDEICAHYNNNHLLSSNSNSSKSAAKDEWVVCRVFHKNMAASKKTIYQGGGDSSHLTRINSFEDVFLDFSPSLPPLMDPTPPSYGGYGRFADNDKHNDNDVKGKIKAAPSSVPAHNYKKVSDIPYGSSSYHMSTPMATSTMLYPNIHHHHHPQFTPNPSLTFQPNSPGYYFKPRIRGHTTSLPNNLGSQETGLSTAYKNTTTETSISSSSGVLKQETEGGSNISYYEHHIESPSAVPIPDIEGLWDSDFQN